MAPLCAAFFACPAIAVGNMSSLGARQAKSGAGHDRVGFAPRTSPVNCPQSGLYWEREYLAHEYKALCAGWAEKKKDIRL